MSRRQCQAMDDALALFKQGGISVDQAARQADVSRSQLYNVLAQIKRVERDTEYEMRRAVA